MRLKLRKKGGKDTRTTSDIVRTKSQGVYVCVCPYCEDTSGHLEADTKKGLWYCHRCNACGNIPNTLSERFSGSLRGFPRLHATILPPKKESPSERLYPPLREDSPEYQYLLDRGCSCDTILDLEPVQFRSGFISCPLREPVQDGAIKGFIHRTIRDSIKPKYLFTQGMERTPWGLHRFEEGGDMVVVEGHFDAAGDPRAIATLGKNIGPTQIIPISSKVFRRCILSLDNDAIGDIPRLVKRIVELSPSILSKLWVTKLPDQKDPEDMGIQWCVDNAVKYSEFL